jgi:hypothetical protein
MVGTTFSVLMRMELSLPGSPFLAGDYHLYNVMVTAHAFIMVFLCAHAGALYLKESGGYHPTSVSQNESESERMTRKPNCLPTRETGFGDHSMQLKPR